MEERANLSGVAFPVNLEQFASQCHRYGKGHILEQAAGIDAASLFGSPGKVLDVATGSGHTGIFIVALGHDVTIAMLPPLEHRFR